MKNFIEIDCLEIQQPIGVFYIGCIHWEDLAEIAKADIRRIERGEGRDVESYLGIQRVLSPNRVKDIGQYVNNLDATFPTSIILHISSSSKDDEGYENEKNLSFDKSRRRMKIRRAEDVANILDGQHRIEGLKAGFADLDLSENSERFYLNVTIFVDLDMDDQSMIFATVNKAQTKVNKSLVYDLFDFAKTNSPQRTAHTIVKLLNNHKGSPFKDMVKILGTADDGEKETITQATLAETIINYISRSPMKDRDLLKRNKKINKTDERNQEALIFRNLFIDEKDEVITSILWNYFSAIQDRWPKAWNPPSLEGNILNKSTGVIAFMKFLKPIYIELSGGKIGKIVEKSDFLRILKKVKLKDEDFNRHVYVPGGIGQSHLYKDLCNQTGLTQFLRN